MRAWWSNRADRIRFGISFASASSALYFAHARAGGGIMSNAFVDQIRVTPSQRDPAYRPAVLIDDVEKAELAKRLGDASNYDLGLLREMIAQAPENIEFRKALVSGIV